MAFRLAALVLALACGASAFAPPMSMRLGGSSRRGIRGSSGWGSNGRALGKFGKFGGRLGAGDGDGGEGDGGGDDGTKSSGGAADDASSDDGKNPLLAAWDGCVACYCCCYASVKLLPPRQRAIAAAAAIAKPARGSSVCYCSAATAATPACYCYCYCYCYCAAPPLLLRGTRHHYYRYPLTHLASQVQRAPRGAAPPHQGLDLARRLLGRGLPRTEVCGEG